MIKKQPQISAFGPWKPPWKTRNNIVTPFSSDVEWRSLWYESSVRNNELVVDPTMRMPGFNIPRKAWVRLNRIRTGHGNCKHFLYLWKLVDNTRCDCGAIDQTMLHIVNDCPVRKFNGGIVALNRLDEGAIEWLLNLDLDL